MKKLPKFEFPAKLERVPKDPPEGLSQVKNIKSWLLVSRGVDRHPYCRVLRQRLKILNFPPNLEWDPRTLQSQLNSQISFLRSSGVIMSGFREKLKILIFEVRFSFH